MRAPRTELT
ncbi:Protein of unknown function [Propionibacterium freudenreichii]|nr:Protein of unknown function [Propionibacterium freudenreichii subsp. freudenreichii]CEG87322.1 Protein of unknown function [Propionibacterium freudenreichii]CEG90631.1 Protein of unknown function [Propionibacterium freudenreichii]CEG93210.1 Protein of unknown function [Propionibacterium freudenreichii]CEG99137.1 Protein of unknown function [Propionibacterium freudenreichii]